jgi:hypothetical protein
MCLHFESRSFEKGQCLIVVLDVMCVPKNLTDVVPEHKLLVGVEVLMNVNVNYVGRRTLAGEVDWAKSLSREESVRHCWGMEWQGRKEWGRMSEKEVSDALLLSCTDPFFRFLGVSPYLSRCIVMCLRVYPDQLAVGADFAYFQPLPTALLHPWYFLSIQGALSRSRKNTFLFLYRNGLFTLSISFHYTSNTGRLLRLFLMHYSRIPILRLPATPKPNYGHTHILIRPLSILIQLSYTKTSPATAFLNCLREPWRVGSPVWCRLLRSVRSREPTSVCVLMRNE